MKGPGAYMLPGGMPVEIRVMGRETPEALCARLASPLCAILRVNRLPSCAWLYPGRAILAPWRGCCRECGGKCPRQSVKTPAGG